MIRNRLENPIILFFVLLVIISINLIASINFFLIMFSGVLFIAFLFIEINSGLKPFSLTLLSLFIYIFIIPKSDSYGSYDLANSYVYMLFFYVGLIIMWSLFYGMDEKIFFALLLNILFDFIFFGVFL